MLTLSSASTTKECAENLDDLVKVSRLNLDTYEPMTRDEWWKPRNPPTNESNPYDGSKMTTVFKPKARFASVIVEARRNRAEKVQLAFAVMYKHGSKDYIPLQNSDGGLIFEGYAGSKIIIPRDIPEVFAFAMYVVNPRKNAKFRISFYGCFGKFQILAFVIFLKLIFNQYKYAFYFVYIYLSCDYSTYALPIKPCRRMLAVSLFC